jgi:sugar lactone lactonase YvrE
MTLVGDPVSGVRFELVPGWGAGLPDLRARDVSDLTVGPGDEVHLLFRDPSSVVVAGADGGLRRTIATAGLTRPHGVAADERHVYVVDEGAHAVRVFEPDGTAAGLIGGGPSDPDFPLGGLHVERITRGRPPFTRPTRMAIAPWGDLYVSDGYGNARIHRFAPDGRHVASWGEPGTGPGEFRIPHAILVDGVERVIVCDRENDRIQVFDRHGSQIETWTGIQRPNAIVADPGGGYIVAEGRLAGGRPSGIAIIDADGRVVGRFGDDGRTFTSAHGLAIDGRGDLYVAECLASQIASVPELVDPERPAVQKVRRCGP